MNDIENKETTTNNNAQETTKEEKKDKKFIPPIDTNKLVENPIKYLLKATVDNLGYYFKQYLDKEINENFNIEDDIKKDIEKMNNLDNDIKQKYKENKVGKRKFANGVIIFFSILIIGLFFLPFLLKNKKYINEFNEYKNNILQVKNEIWANKNQKIWDIFKRFQFNDFINGTLKQMGITEVYNSLDSIYAFSHLSENYFTKDKSFVSFLQMQTYDIRNSIFMNMLLIEEEWQIITTQASKTYSYTVNGETRTTTVTSYHHERTPFMNLKPYTIVPTKFLPELEFMELEGLTKGEYNKKYKKGEFLFENEEFCKNYWFSFNNELKILTYFPQYVQERYINYKNTLKELQLKENKVFKSKKYLISKNDSYHDAVLSMIDYDSKIRVNLATNQNLTIKEIMNDLYQQSIMPIISIAKILTKMYLNKFIASENLEIDTDSYVMTHKDLQEINNKYEKNQITIMGLNAIGKYRPYTITHPRNDRIGWFDVWKVDMELTTYGLKMDIPWNSYYYENEIDHSQEVSVPYKRYYPIVEFKSIHIIEKQDKNIYDLKELKNKLLKQITGFNISADRITLEQDEFNIYIFFDTIVKTTWDFAIENLYKILYN
ncbi:Uncharacterised protein [Metamycoplasma cloacale]|uniref:Uncharacterized protein n=1 Tax=Metamycoplasma cloacale TaxID=92401 RepID=A0A2Z4LM65_9BACT|nr:hypothetical protein [Metamycoplasma cloacale]AWX42891.1 hypothetical protein DK849_02370 [Metamycoplasma cloacale]VEU79285.1 Uncharacterised protein [Metamycoplasma cloacale]